MKGILSIILLVLAGTVLWFELVAVPTALARYLELSQAAGFAVVGWQVLKVVVLAGGSFAIGNLAGRKGVFAVHERMVENHIAPLNVAIANLHRDVTGAALHTVGRAVLDGTKLGVKMGNASPTVSRVELLAGLDQLALPPVTGQWVPADDETSDLEQYKAKL